MNRKYAAAAMSALALGAVALNAAEASAKEAPDPQYGNTTPEYNYPNYDPQHHGNMTTPDYKVGVPTSPSDQTRASGDDTGIDMLPAGASALGAAGVGLGLWLYRRRRQAAA